MMAGGAAKPPGKRAADEQRPWWHELLPGAKKPRPAAEPTVSWPTMRPSAEVRETQSRVDETIHELTHDRRTEDAPAVLRWMEHRSRSGRITDDFTDSEYQILIDAATQASHVYAGIDVGGEVAQAATALRNSMSLRVGESQPTVPQRGSFHATIPDVGALQSSNLVAESRHFARRRYKRSTDANVNTVRRHWFTFTITKAKTSPIRPLVGKSLSAAMLEEDLWISFSSWLARKVGGATVGQYISLLKRWHKSVTGWDPISSSITDNVMLTQTLAGIRAELPSASRKRFAHPTRLFKEWWKPMDTMTSLGCSLMDLEPTRLDTIPFEDLKKTSEIIRAVAETVGMQMEELKYLIASTSLTAGLMRISEACPSNAEQNLITRGDVKFTWDADGKLVRVGVMMQPLKKKAGGNTPKVEVVLGNGRGNVRAAYFLWLMFLLDPVPESELDSTPLFRNWSWEERKPGVVLDQTRFREWYSKRMSESGITHWKHYNLHSFRIGGATALMAAGISMEFIKAMGRWASDTYEVYTRPTRAQMLELSRALDSSDISPFEDADDEYFDRQAGVTATHEEDAAALAQALAAEADEEMED